jgi:alpha-ribazole phosphatase
MRLVLVRHAEAEEAVRGRVYGSLDVGLSERGRAQAHQLAQALGSVPVTQVVASPRLRALDTAAPIASALRLPVRCDERLRELDFGELEGRTYDEIAATLPELYAQWMRMPTAVRFPGGESYEDLRARAVAAVTELRSAHDGETVIVVTHGGIVRATVADALGVPAERIFRLTVEPASVAVIEWLEDVPLLRSLGARVSGELLPATDES